MASITSRLMTPRELKIFNRFFMQLVSGTEQHRIDATTAKTGQTL